MTTTCHATAEGYMVAGEHLDGCTEATCAGCWPCVPRSDIGDPLDHCTGYGACSEHVPVGVTVCPRCVGKVRTILRRIAELTPLLPVAAVEAARIDSEAVNLAGPAPSPVLVSEARRTALSAATAALMEGREDEWAAIMTTLPDDDPSHPYAVLGRWALMIGEDYGHDHGVLTVSTSAGYLDRQLTRIAADPEQDWRLLRRELKACLTAVESVLAVHFRPETGAPCPACLEAGVEKPRHLVKRYGQTVREDRWKCSTCNTEWQDVEYRLRIGADYLREAEALSAADMALRFPGLKATIVRVWGSRGIVSKRGKDGNGVTLYDVADVEARLKGEEASA